MDCSTQETNQRIISCHCLDPHNSDVQVDKIKSSPAVWLARLGNFLILLFKGSDEIQVWQRRDRNGQLWWYAYNPRNQHSGVFESESEIRVWVEQQRHH